MIIQDTSDMRIVHRCTRISATTLVSVPYYAKHRYGRVTESH